MLVNLKRRLGEALIERDAEIEALLLGLVAHEHVLLVGPPGTAKSHLCRSLAAGIEGLRLFEFMLSGFSSPDKLFGPPDLDGVRAGTAKITDLVLEGRAADCHMLFLDEVFRAGQAVLDDVLQLLGPERQFLVGNRQVKVPLMSAIGASNTWAEGSDQHAIFDRWLIRRVVKPVSPSGRQQLLFGSLPEMTPVVTLADVKAANEVARKLPVSDDAQAAMLAILDELHAAGICPSDRRCRKAIGVARAAAVLEVAPAVERHHLECLENVLWDLPEHADKAADIIRRIANPVGARLTEILREVDDIVAAATDVGTRIASVKKLEASEAEARKLSVSGNGRAKKVLEHICQERVRLTLLATGMDAAKVAANAAQLGKK